MRTSLLIALAALTPTITSAQAPRARTTNGLVSGATLASGVRNYRGIPFAAPPVRENRWRPPQPVASWTGVRRADRFADQCMQARIFQDMVFRNSGTSEDCLYLNVWQPKDASPTTKLPVLVYYYGGGFVGGDGSEPRYDGESLAQRGVVVVTMSYRLGVFGFFAHPGLSAESPRHASGNYALMDQSAALRWVRANVAAFGGDPAKVTIGGESAGSFSVSAQMASPESKTLFARAIGESGSLLGREPLPTRESMEQNGARFADMVGASSLADLRALSAHELLSASMAQGAPRFGPCVDGLFFTEQPSETFAAGRQARVPLLAGWNSLESSAGALVRGTPTPDSARAVFARLFGDRATEAASLWPASTNEETMASLNELASLQWIAYGTWRWLDLHARTSGQPVWRYYYARPRPAVSAAMANAPGAPQGPPAPGAVHSAEIEYALGNLPRNKVFAWTPEDYAVSRTMEGYFENFIKTGDPNGAGLPRWPAGTVGANGDVQRIHIDVDTRAEAEPRQRYLFLERVYSQSNP